MQCLYPILTHNYACNSCCIIILLHKLLFENVFYSQSQQQYLYNHFLTLHMYIMCHFMFIASTAPQPNVVITSSQSAPFFVGTALNLTCTITNVENGYEITVEWSGPRNISGDRYNVSSVNGSGNIYIVHLIIDPVMVQDEGIYTCIAIITGGSSNQLHNTSGAITVTVISK